jgi:alkylated DNA repair dioxygenase AlkB
VPELDVHRGWNDDPGLLAAVRELFAYDDDNRANGYLYTEGAQDWPASLAGYGPKLLAGLEQLIDVRFTIALFQAYRDGSGVHWHTDTGYDVQAILSLGVTRTFAVRRPGEDPVRLPLHSGDLAVMPSGFQAEWEHCVPTEDVTGERVSLVFRAVRS